MENRFCFKSIISSLRTEGKAIQFFQRTGRLLDCHVALLLAMTIMSSPLSAAENHHASEHGGQVFHRFSLEADVGNSREGTLSSWDFDGWVGDDENKLWLKSEGEMLDGATEHSELWAMYSRNVGEFWDAQIGLRQDVQPESTTYLVAGFDGLAPYLFETQAHIFVSDRGDTSLRLRQENDLLITQQIILQPYFEVNIFAQDVPQQDIGAGIANGEIGLQTRYEITRKFAPYIDLRYERKFGETASIAKEHGDANDDFIASVGVKLMF